jgi:hypothetical protein
MRVQRLGLGGPTRTRAAGRARGGRGSEAGGEGSAGRRSAAGCRRRPAGVASPSPSPGGRRGSRAGDLSGSLEWIRKGWAWAFGFQMQDFIGLDWAAPQANIQNIGYENFQRPRPRPVLPGAQLRLCAASPRVRRRASAAPPLPQGERRPFLPGTPPRPRVPIPLPFLRGQAARHAQPEPAPAAPNLESPQAEARRVPREGRRGPGARGRPRGRLRGPGTGLGFSSCLDSAGR